MLPLRIWFVLLALFISTSPLALAQEEFHKKPFDWPQWQGPQRNTISRETGLLQEWPTAGPTLLWKITDLGEGYSTPSVAAGRIFTMGHTEGQEYVFCLREKDGSLLWKTSLGPARRVSYEGTRCTPTVDGDRVYALGVDGALACLEAASGDIRWQKDLKKDFDGRRGGWGYAESPLIDGDKLLCTPGGQKATLAALHKMTGATIWTCAIPEGYAAGYSSIIKADVDGLPQYIQFLGGGRSARKGAVVGVRASDGKFLWSFSDPGNSTANISSPVFADNHVFAASAYGTGGALAELKRTGDKTAATVVYFTPNMQNHHGGMILLDGYLYGSNGGRLACLDFKTGKAAWQSKQAGKGSIFYADHRLYYRNERDGTVYLVEANPQKYIEHGRLQQPERSGRNAWAHPIVANGRLYIADQNVLLCYDVKARD